MRLPPGLVCLGFRAQLSAVSSKTDAGTSSLFEKRSQEAGVRVEESVSGGV